MLGQFIFFKFKRIGKVVVTIKIIG
uniref:Uncharacterized protein n=1 Tax=Anguilla anguilla TaxID=7936 RepID=A0A0E9PZC6_ANGAN